MTQLNLWGPNWDSPITIGTIVVDKPTMNLFVLDGSNIVQKNPPTKNLFFEKTRSAWKRMRDTWKTHTLPEFCGDLRIFC